MGSRIAGAVALATLVAALGAGDARASFPAGQGRIVTVSEALFFTSLSLINPDASPVPGFGLRFPVGVGGGGSVSPDGTSIAFSSTVPLPTGPSPTGPFTADSEIYVAGVAGGVFEAITDNDALDGRPTWSSDGRRIAFGSNRDGDWDIYTTRVSGGEAETVNLTADSPARDMNPRWSPDGRWIAFESDRSGNPDIFLVPSGGGSASNLTAHPATDRLGDWSPDSTRLVFSSTRAGAGYLFIVPAAAGTPVPVATGPGTETRPAWSPDGRTIAFSSDRDGDNDAFLIGVDGVGERQLTRNASEDLVQDWQPLRDTQAPTVRTLAGSGVHGRPIRLRYQVVEDSGRARIELEYSFTVRNGGVGGIFFSSELEDVSSGGTRVVTIPARVLREHKPPFIRFCVTATDASANQSEESCARYTLKKPPKKKKPKRKR